MKKIIGALFFLLAAVCVARADYTRLRDAGDLTRGTLDAARLPSNITVTSVTATQGIFGPVYSTNVASGDQLVEVAASTTTTNNRLLEVVTSTTSILQGNTTALLTVNGTTQTKSGGLNVAGSLSANKITIGGSELTSVRIGTSNAVFGLVITTNGASTNQVVVTAKSMEIMGNYFYNFSSSVLMNVVGVGGTDFAEISSACYRIYAISNDAGSLSGVIASTNATTPVLPSGWTKWHKVGEIKNDGAGNIIPTIKRNGYTTLWTRYQVASVADAEDNITTIDLMPYITTSTYMVDVEARITGEAAATRMEFILWGDGHSRFVAGEEAGQITVAAANGANGLSVSQRLRIAIPSQSGKLLYVDQSTTTGEFLLFLVGYQEAD